MNHVYSTMTAGVNYTFYAPGGEEGINTETRRIHINGGSNVAHKKTLVTPLGVGTEVSDEELEALRGHSSFKRHLGRGFLEIVSGKKDDADKVAQGMTDRDASAPLTPEDFVNREGGAPITKESFEANRAPKRSKSKKR